MEKTSLFEEGPDVSAENRISPVYLSDRADADLDFRKACNALKRMTTAASACVLSGADPACITELIDETTALVLSNLGFSASDEKRVHSVFAMMAEPVSLIIADAAARGMPSKVMYASVKSIAKAMAMLARSKTATNMVPDQIPVNSPEAISLRLSTAAALAAVAAEVAHFNFFLGAERCLKEAASHVTKAASTAVDFLLDFEIRPVSDATRVMLTQSLLNSSGKVYAACLHAGAAEMIAKLRGLPDDQARHLEASMATNEPAEVLAVVNKQFHALFSECINGYADKVHPLPPVKRPHTGP